MPILKIIEFVLFYAVVFMAGFTIWTLSLPLVEYLDLQRFTAMNIATITMGYLIGRRATYKSW